MITSLSGGTGDSIPTEPEDIPTDMQSQNYPAEARSCDLPAPAPWSAVAIRLLQGVVYHDDNSRQWELLLSNSSALVDYFGKLGLLLVVNETDAMAYLKQPNDEELPAEYESVPRLFRRTSLSYEATILCVLLRDELRQFEEEDIQNERCVIPQNDLLATWKAFFPIESDEIGLNRTLGKSLRKLEELKFVRQFEKDPPSWEIRRIIKARLPLSDLEQLRSSLIEAAAKSNSQQNSDATNG